MIITTLSCAIILIAIFLLILSLLSDCEPFGISRDLIVTLFQILNAILAGAIIIYHNWG